MPPNDMGDHYNVTGLHGTIAEQTDEAFYDDRSDASDDLEKGRLKFPSKIYGRERELETLLNIYDDLTSCSNDGSDSGEKKIPSISEENEEKKRAEKKVSISEGEKPEDVSCDHKGSQIVFLSGYSGIGKSALVDEFVKQVRGKYQSSSNNDPSPILYASGKYTEKSSASAPFSAISEVLEQLAMELSKGSNTGGESYQSKVQNKIKASELIGPGSEGDRILRAIFPVLVPLLDKSIKQKKSEDTGLASAVHPSMNAIKECTKELFSIISGALDHPLVVFLDDLQWGDQASIEMLESLLSDNKLMNSLFICAYRSNEVHADHSFSKLMDNVTKTRSGNKQSNNEPLKFVERMDLFSLSPEAIANFIADSIKKEDAEGVRDLAEAVYAKTMGNIFFTKAALEELVRKNVLFYDIMCFEWRFVVSKVELANYMSDDVVETVKGKIRDLSTDIQHLLVVMAYIPNAVHVNLLRVLTNHGEHSFDENTIKKLLGEASDEGLLIFSVVSGCHVFAHDRIRQASMEFATERDQDELLLHISHALQDFAAQRAEMEWCLYVAVDLLNTISSDKTEYIDLIKLNLKVSKIAKSRGSVGKENELLHIGLKRLESAGVAWKQYDLTLELCNAVIVSDYNLGLYSSVKIAIGQVIKNARTMDDRLQAYLYELLCEKDETKDYKQAAVNGVKILNLYGFDIPTSISNTYILKEGTKLKMAMRNRSYSCLIELPMKDNPIFMIIQEVQSDAAITSNDNLLKVIAWKAIRHALKRGAGRHLPMVLASIAVSMNKRGKLETAQELANVSIALADKSALDLEMVTTTRMFSYTVLLQLQPFYALVEPVLQCHKNLKLAGGPPHFILGSMIQYFEAFFAAGLEVGPLVESKLLLAEELCHNLGRPGFLTSFQIYRQFAINLRTRTRDPTEFKGEAFDEEKELNEMNANAHKMALRDSSSFLLQLAFVFWDEDKMAEMLERLMDYPPSDLLFCRLHNRLCFTGLAAIAMCQRGGCKQFSKLGQSYLCHFERLTKHGSVNAKPVYLFMLALKVSNGKAFLKAIEACAEARMINLEAMAKERFAMLLRNENQIEHSNEYLTSSYWLYQDWGAHAKALQLSQKYDFLKHVKRQNPLSVTVSATRSEVSSRKDGVSTAFSFNSTFKSRKKILVKQ